MFNQTAENLFSCICPEGYAGLTCETGMCDNYVCIIYHSRIIMCTWYVLQLLSPNFTPSLRLLFNLIQT